MAETDDHLILKQLAVNWARVEGYLAVGTEVRLPNSGFRADAAGCRMERPRAREFRIERTVAFECKQSRADFLNDSFEEKGSAERLRTLLRRRDKLERLVGAHYPTLRQGDSLFPEFESSDPLAIRHEGYRKLSSEISRLERGLSKRTKFDRMIRYRCVDLCYLVVKKGLIEPWEAPSGWGVLEWDGREFEPGSEGLSLLKKPRWNAAREHHRLDLLHRLALRGSPQKM